MSNTESMPVARRERETEDIAAYTKAQTNVRAGGVERRQH
jgi:hypothetical protein